MKKDLLLVFGLLFLVAGLLISGRFLGSIPGFGKNQTRNIIEVRIKSHTFQAEIAKSESQHAKGLSARDSLGKDAGMLFVFNKPGRYQFWMKNTKIPLDIIWIDQNKKIVDYYKEAQPQIGVSDDQLRLYSPSALSYYVLEVNAKTIDNYQISIGDSVDFSL